MNKFIFTALLTCIVSALSFSQDRELDKLEMYYDQGHFKIVYRKANKLIDNPDYDYTVVPSFYKSMALFQLCQNKSYLKRNKNALNEAISLWEKFLSEDDNKKVFEAHIYEIINLKQDIILWREDVKSDGDQDLVLLLDGFLHSNLASVEEVDRSTEEIVDLKEENLGETEKSKIDSKRLELLEYSKTLIGIKYRYGGMDKKGFDCSGFTSYVFKKIEVTLPRRAADQYAKSKKIKIKEAKAGDLVFFSNGGNVNHVGIIVSNKDGRPIMIHASTSQGITETDILSNSYWRPRLKYVGSYLD